MPPGSGCPRLALRGGGLVRVGAANPTQKVLTTCLESERESQQTFRDLVAHASCQGLGLGQEAPGSRPAGPHGAEHSL